MGCAYEVLVILLLVGTYNAAIARDQLSDRVSPREVRIWYYANNKTWESDIAMLRGNISSITGVSFGCGHQIDLQGKLRKTYSNAFCAKVIQAIGVPTTLIVGEDSVKISEGMRQAMAEPLVLAKELNGIGAAMPHSLFKGWQFDFEPQKERVTPHDIETYPKFLMAIKNATVPQNNTQNMRLTADVASWSKFLSQFKELAPSVTQLINMETYGGYDKLKWYTFFARFYDSTPLSKVGVGLGDYFTKGYTATEADVTEIFKYLTEKHVSEVDVFRFDPQAPYPNQSWWWDLMKKWKNHEL